MKFKFSEDQENAIKELSEFLKDNKKNVITLSGEAGTGKTTVIKGITGKDTDTLPEEKKRGMTIDLGFTFFTLSFELSTLSLYFLIRAFRISQGRY